MTDYQKKKLIDLVLALIAVVLVGLFLRTQLKDPIIIVSETPEVITEGGYVNTWMYESNAEDSDERMIDRVSVSMDEAFLDVTITQSQKAQPEILKWQIWFDSNEDEAVEGDLLISIDKALNVSLSRIENGEAVQFGEGEASLDEGVLLVRLPNSRRIDIVEETPFKIEVVFNQNGQEMTQYLP